MLLAFPAGSRPAHAQTRYDHLRLIAPAAPGGGWDQTARVMQQVVQRTGTARTVSVENVPGAAGLIGLARFVGAERGNGDALLVSGLIMLGAIVTQRSAVTLDDVTPIARLTGEYEVLTVPAESPFRTLNDLVQALRQRPESISWGGGSAGGSDQILAGLIADAVGVAPRRVNYIAFSGGGEALAAVLGGQVSVGINGLAEFAAQIEAGTVRPLAISSAERLPGLDIPALREQGVDIEFENWRSVVAPPGIDAADRRRLEAAVGAMVRSADWKEMLGRYRWIDRYLAGDPFARFTDAEERRVQDILTKFGTQRGRHAVSLGGRPVSDHRTVGTRFCGLATRIDMAAANGHRRQRRARVASDCARDRRCSSQSRAGRTRRIHHRVRDLVLVRRARLRPAPSVARRPVCGSGVGERISSLRPRARSAASRRGIGRLVVMS